MTPKSSIEARFNEHLCEQYYPFTFQDKEGAEFKAKTDMIMYNTITDTLVYIELKPKECNTVSTIRTAGNNSSFQCNRHNLNTQGTHYMLSNRLIQSGNRGAVAAGYSNAWSNSIVKQSIVSDVVTASGKSFLLVFEKHSLDKCKIRKKQHSMSDYYKIKYNIDAIYAEELEEMIMTGVLINLKETIH